MLEVCAQAPVQNRVNIKANDIRFMILPLETGDTQARTIHLQTKFTRPVYDASP